MQPTPPNGFATHHPRFDPCCSRFQRRRDGFEDAYFPGGNGIDSYSRKAADFYMDGAARELVRCATSVFLAIVRTQQAAAEYIILNRSSLSVAKNRGELGSRPLANIISIPTVAKNLSNRMPLLNRQLGRAAFIAAANFTANYLSIPRSTVNTLDVISYEIACRWIERPVPRFDEDLLLALPDWYNKTERGQARKLIKKLCDPAAMADYLAILDREWLDILIYVWATTEGLGAPDLWEIG